MKIHEIIDAISSLGGFAGLAAIVTALGATRRMSNASAKITKELSPNHGSSIKDALQRIEEVQRDHGERLHELRKDVQTLQVKELLS